MAGVGSFAPENPLGPIGHREPNDRHLAPAHWRAPGRTTLLTPSLRPEALAAQCPRSSPPGSRAPAGTAMASRLESLGEVRPVLRQPAPAATAGAGPSGDGQPEASLSQRLPAAGGQVRGPSGGAVLAPPTPPMPQLGDSRTTSFSPSPAPGWLTRLDQALGAEANAEALRPPARGEHRPSRVSGAGDRDGWERGNLHSNSALARRGKVNSLLYTRRETVRNSG